MAEIFASVGGGVEPPATAVAAAVASFTSPLSILTAEKRRTDPEMDTRASVAL